MVENADKECLLPKIGWNVEEKSVIVTDSYHTYNDLSNNYKHKSVKHSANEYVRNEIDCDGRLKYVELTNGKWVWNLLILQRYLIGSVEHALHRLDITHDILVQLNNLGWNVDEKDPKCNVF